MYHKIITAESVTEGHPDKLCDLISDNILDACLQKDKQARVACEVLATKGKITIAGEITSSYEPDIPSIVRNVLMAVGYNGNDFEIEVMIRQQSPDIAGGVDRSLENRCGNEEVHLLGAGDQGVMVGYATTESTEMMPTPVVLANRITSGLIAAYYSGIIQGIKPDGKAQVSVQYEVDEETGTEKPVRLNTVVISVQHEEMVTAGYLFQEISEKVLEPALRGFPMDEDTRILINPSGRFVLGGLDADTGLTGRKLMVDTYGPVVPHGGGAFSGKDPTKVDRSGAYMARYIAKNLVAAGLAERCQVTLAYAIGVAEPVSVTVDTFGTGIVCADDCLETAVREVFDMTPDGIIRTLDLLNVAYRFTSCYGHFGRAGFPWEQTDKIGQLREVLV